MSLTLIARNPSPRYCPSSTFLIVVNNAHKPRGREGLGDTNYCVVNAFAAAFGITWAESAELLARLGRKKRKGISTWAAIEKKAVEAYGEVREAKWLYKEVECGRVGWRYKTVKPSMTISTFLKQCDPSKRYVVTVSHHALAVVNGKVTGEDKLSRRIKKVWEVTPHLQRPGAINLPAIVNKNLTTPVSCEKV
jgi:hypothetical protein